MSAFGVQVLMGQYLAEVGAVAWGRAVPGGYEIAAGRGADEEAAFEAFQSCCDHLVATASIDPTKETLTWLGVLDIIPRDFHKLSAGGPK